MLTQIHIRDLATIEELQLNLTRGSTMITGETGAGKSIFIEAIELALGGRASANMIRPGKERTEITLCFDITEFPKVVCLLQELDLFMGGYECIIRRIIMNDGRSRCYINGSPCTLQQVKELGDLLFHLHGQHEQQVLLKSETQRDMLDRYADHLGMINELKLSADTGKMLDKTIKNLIEKSVERLSRTDYLRFQLDELNTLQLKQGEWEMLEAEQRRLAHAGELIRNIQSIVQQINLDDSQTILSSLNSVRKTLESINNIEKKSNEWINTVNSCLIQLSDLSAELENYLEQAELDPEKLHAIEERISKIFDLSRKYKITPQELLNFKQKIESELNALTASDDDLIKLEKERASIEKTYHDLTEKLSQSRKKALVKLEKEINNTIRSLSLPHGQFKIDLESVEIEEWSPHGLEKIVFLIKTNPDQALQPVAKVISGGELSRLSLAVHLALANKTTIPTLVFDEVDTGLSGATAEKIGKLLRKLGDSYQVFCVTHQAQVAACGHQHLLVEKCIVSDTTHTRLRMLTKNEKAQEIARMLGGEKITKKTLEHAEEMLQGI